MIAQIRMNADMSVPRGGCREQKPCPGKPGSGKQTRDE